MEALRNVALHLSSAIAAMGPFEVISDGSEIPVLTFKLKDPSRFTAFHVSDQLRTGGWQVPAYTLPENAIDIAVLRIVVREGFDLDLADALIESLGKAVAHLEEFPPTHPPPASGFVHV